jgi:hypothetical protein
VELSVAVQVNPAEATHADDDFRRMEDLAIVRSGKRLKPPRGNSSSSPDSDFGTRKAQDRIVCDKMRTWSSITPQLL